MYNDENRTKKYKKLTAELTLAQFNAVTAYAKKNGISKSDVVRNALTAHIRTI